MTDPLLAVVQADVGLTARSWDEHHLRLVAAAEQVGSAPVGGLDRDVVGASLLFRYRWADHVRDVGAGAEQRADGLRDALREVLAADGTSALDSARLAALLREVR